MQIRTVHDRVVLVRQRTDPQTGRDVEESFALSVAEALAILRQPEFAEAVTAARRNARERLVGEIAAHELIVKRLKEQMS
jgi:hypothetical protein